MLLESGASEVEVNAADQRAADIVAAASQAAQAAPEADPDEAFTDVWADGGNAWRT